jgi:hypothetical protein
MSCPTPAPQLDRSWASGRAAGAACGGATRHSSAIIERHDAAYIVDAPDEVAARGVVPLVSKSAGIVALRGSADTDAGKKRNRAQPPTSNHITSFRITPSRMSWR